LKTCAIKRKKKTESHETKLAMPPPKQQKEEDLDEGISVIRLGEEESMPCL